MFISTDPALLHSGEASWLFSFFIFIFCFYDVGCFPVAMQVQNESYSPKGLLHVTVVGFASNRTLSVTVDFSRCGMIQYFVALACF